MRTPEETAVLLSLLLRRSGQKRARVSLETIRHLAKRKQLRHVFIDLLDEQLDELGVVLIEITRGGYGLLLASTLDGAPSITAKKYLAEDLALLKTKATGFEDIRRELEEAMALEE